MFKQGDKVKIRKDSYYYNRSPGNPGDVDGVITTTNNTYRYVVAWDNDTTNSYTEGDLELSNKEININLW